MKPLAQNTLIQNRYLVVHLIGKGGMGEVYLAVDQRLGSAVALKRTFFAGDEMLGNAFEREARTLARMRHPVLPKVSDHFGEGDEQYLVMEHISGDDLSKRLDAAGKPFPVSWVLFWADQLLDALSYLHTHEPPIIHRDIKPQNLKLTDENHVILLDFGLSKTSTGQTNISQSGSTGSVVGYTPHYAPMEQIRGIGTSPRSDLYSLSATLYQLMTNTIPVDALSRADAMLNELPDPIKPPHELNPEIPKSVSEVLLRGMEVSQEKRYANAREMQRVLRKAFSDIQQATTASTIAFTAEEAGAAGLTPAVPDAGNSESSVSRQSQPEATPIAPDSNIDLDATMAFGAADVPLQSGVQTEVFFGGNSDASDEQPPAAESTSDPQSGSTPFGTESDRVPSDTANFTADATVPFIAVGDLTSQTSAQPSDTMDFGSIPAAGEFSASAESRQPTEEPPPPVEAPPPSPNAYAAAAAPVAAKSKGSGGKALVIVGILAGLLVLGAALGGGVWAYLKYGTAPTPTPTPEPTPEQLATPTPTPSPEPTVESNANVNATNANTSNSDANSNVTVEPTPVRTPVPDEPVGTRPTPKPAGTPVRPVSTPGPRPTPPPKKTPSTRPTPLQ